MNKLLPFLISITMLACTTQHTTSVNNTKTSKPAKPGNKMYGKVVVKSSRGDENSSAEMPQYYFEVYGESYFIKFSESKVTKDEVKPIVFKEVDIRGEIKTGIIFNSNVSKKGEEEASGTTGEYIVIYEIIG